MELKLCIVGRVFGLGELLIVPYGIETEQGQQICAQLARLLIVPYGIETATRLTHTATR